MASGALLLCGACVLATLLAAVQATHVSACQEAGSRLLKDEEIEIVNCTKPPCKLRKRSTIFLNVHFTPEEDVESVRNAVFANIVGIPFPFIGVDGKMACPEIHNVDGSKADCPLKQGKEYVYKGSFKVLDIYPRIRVDVVWSLKDNNDKKLFCFVVPVRIL